MKLLVVDHNALDPANRILYEKLVALGGVEVRLVVPKRWFNNYRMLEFSEPRDTLSYQLVASDVLFPSRAHRMIYRSLAKQLSEFRPDILYVNAEPENFQTFQAAYVNDRVNGKLVFSSWRNVDHALIGYPYKFSSLHKRIEKYVLMRAAYGIVFNPTAVKIFAQNGFDRVAYIPHPVNTEIFRPAPRERAGDRFVVGYVGRLVAPKGVDLLIRAIAQLPAHCSAIIVGDGPERENLQNLARELDISRRVEFYHPISSAEMQNTFQRMDALVLPSRTTKFWREQFGRVLIEAMASGVPVIGSSSGEIPSVIGTAGLMFKEGSADELVHCLTQLEAHQALKEEMRRRGMERVASHFSLEIVARQYHKAFSGL